MKLRTFKKALLSLLVWYQASKNTKAILLANNDTKLRQTHHSIIISHQSSYLINIQTKR